MEPTVPVVSHRLPSLRFSIACVVGPWGVLLWGHLGVVVTLVGAGCGVVRDVAAGEVVAVVVVVVDRWY